ncbi:MAG: hypothetical protein ACI8SE_000938, partial [Bacteroidia bacterium]
FSEPLSAYGTGIKYSGNYSYLRPVDSYYPGSLKYPYNNPNANTPIGIHLNAETGDFIFTPTQCNEHTVVVIEVTEWRKNVSTGKMVKVGISRRDIELKQKQCPGNYPPVILSETFQYRACEGEFICISIESEDKVNVPPPPLPTPKGDSVFLSWNRGIAQGKFVVTKDTFESANFCWTPDSGSSRVRPYTFIVYADDDRCGGVLRSQRTFQIIVNPPSPNYTLSVDSVTCGAFALSNSLSKVALSKLHFSLIIRPILGTIAPAYFTSTGSAVSWSPEDWIRMTRSGSYELTYELECGKTVVDTLVVGEFPQMPLLSDMEICFDAGDLDLTKLDTFGNPGVWSCPSQPNLIDSKYLFKTDSIVGGATSITKQVYYTKGSLGSCGVEDSFEIRINPLPRVELRDGYFCQDNNTINVKQDKIIVRPGGAALSLGRQNWSCIDCGIYKESDIIEDISGGGPGAPQNFVLHIGSNAIPLGSKSKDSILIEMEFRNALGCFNRDTATIVVHKEIQKLNSFSTELCWNEGVVNLNKLVYRDPVVGTWSAYSTPGYSVPGPFNFALEDSLLHISLTGSPSQSVDSVYKVKFEGKTNYCSFKLDTAIRIKGVTIPEIDRVSLFYIRKSLEPYAFCELDDPALFKAVPAGGTWTADEKVFVQQSFLVSWVTKFDKPFYARYDYTNANGCVGRDSVPLVVHEQHTLSIPNDTAITWYADEMLLDVTAIFTNSIGVIWSPLTSGGKIDQPNAPNTTYRFGGSKDTIFRNLLHVRTKSNIKNVCPFVETTMILVVHPTPCMDVNMEYDLSTKTLKLSPSKSNMATYKWEVDGTTDTSMNPTINMSNASDSLIWVKLTATNQIGDKCVSYNKINVNTGAVTDLNQLAKLYPNPVKEGFTIETKTELLGAEIRIYSSNGSLVSSSKLSTTYVDCEKLVSGVYTIRIQTTEGQFIGRFVKE